MARWLVAYHVKRAAIVDASTPEQAARFATAKSKDRLVPNSITVYADDDPAGDRPIRVTLP